MEHRCPASADVTRENCVLGLTSAVKATWGPPAPGWRLWPPTQFSSLRSRVSPSRSDSDTPNWPTAAIGVSAFSNVLTGWAQGGPVAIHGTNEPWSIGHAVSNGCIRLPNATLKRVFRETLAGTPVIIHP